MGRRRACDAAAGRLLRGLGHVADHRAGQGRAGLLGLVAVGRPAACDIGRSARRPAASSTRRRRRARPSSPTGRTGGPSARRGRARHPGPPTGTSRCRRTARTSAASSARPSSGATSRPGARTRGSSRAGPGGRTPAARHAVPGRRRWWRTASDDGARSVGASSSNANAWRSRSDPTRPCDGLPARLAPVIPSGSSTQVRMTWANDRPAARSTAAASASYPVFE